MYNKYIILLSLYYYYYYYYYYILILNFKMNQVNENNISVPSNLSLKAYSLHTLNDYRRENVYIILLLSLLYFNFKFQNESG